MGAESLRLSSKILDAVYIFDLNLMINISVDNTNLIG